jgi:hypothetical protein
MPRRALRSSPTKDATDLTDEQWAAIAPLVAALAACVGWCDGWGVQDADGRRRIAIERVSRRVPQRSIDGNDGSITTQ